MILIGSWISISIRIPTKNKTISFEMQQSLATRHATLCFVTPCLVFQDTIFGVYHVTSPITIYAYLAIQAGPLSGLSHPCYSTAQAKLALI